MEIFKKKLNNSRKKLKTQDKNSRFRQSKKRGLPKTRPEKACDFRHDHDSLIAILGSPDARYYHGVMAAIEACYAATHTAATHAI